MLLALFSVKSGKADSGGCGPESVSRQSKDVERVRISNTWLPYMEFPSETNKQAERGCIQRRGAWATTDMAGAGRLRKAATSGGAWTSAAGSCV